MLNIFQRLLDYLFFRQDTTTPRSLIFFVTSRCNSFCKHCFYWRHLNKKNDLSLGEIEELTKSLGLVDSLNISGGEPFLRNDLPEIINFFYLYNHLRVVMIPSNGLLVNKIFSQTEKILQYANGKTVTISFSLDGTEKIHDEIRGVKGSFQRVIDSYKKISELKKKYPNLKIQVNTVITNENELDVRELIKKVKTVMPGVALLSISFLRGSPHDRHLFLPSPENLRKLEEMRNLTIPPKSLITRLIDMIIFSLKIKALKERKQVIPCEAGRVIGVITEDGEVKQCELLPSIGNLRRTNFKKIWNSQKAKKERQKIVEGKCWCTHECFLFPSLIVHPIKGLKEAFFV